MRADGSVYLLVANNNPALTEGEDLAESAKALGTDYDAPVSRIVNPGLSYIPKWRMFE